MVYLHSDEHENTPAFCRETFGSQRVLEFLQENFVVWSLSVAYPAGHEMSAALGATTYIP